MTIYTSEVTILKDDNFPSDNNVVFQEPGQLPNREFPLLFVQKSETIPSLILTVNYRKGQ